MAFSIVRLSCVLGLLSTFTFNMCQSLHHCKRHHDLRYIASFRNQKLLRRLLFNMQNKAQLLARHATSDRNFLADIFSTPTYKGTSSDNLASVSNRYKLNNKRAGGGEDFKISNNYLYKTNDQYDIPDKTFDIMEYDKLNSNNRPYDVVPEPAEKPDVQFQQEGNYKFDTDDNTHNDLDVSYLDYLSDDHSNQWLDSLYKPQYDTDASNTYDTYNSDESKTTNDIMDIEETLPLSAVVNSELLSKSEEVEHRASDVQNDFGEGSNVNNDFNNDNIGNVNMASNVNDNIGVSYSSDPSYETDNEEDGKSADSLFWYNGNENEDNSDERDETLENVSADEEKEEYGNEISAAFIRTLVKTIQFLLSTVFTPKTVQTQPMKRQYRSPLTPKGTFPYFVTKRKRPFYNPNRIPSTNRRRRRKNRKQKNRSKKLYLYGEDDRMLVFLPLMRKYPFSNVVRLSSGCTGTLLTPRHVLTAAHCVHDGENFKQNLQMLKIEIPDTMGFRVYYIQKIGIPKAWRRSGHLTEVARASYDYAIVRLNIGVPGKTTFLPLSVPKSNILNQDMNFLGFPTDESSGLYKSKCHAYYSVAYMDGNLILTRCDSAVGNSGAAVFIDDPRDGKKIVGVLSSMSFTSRYSIITALTWNKLYEICSMMAPLGQQYGVCPSFETILRSNKTPQKNTVLPFFG